MISLVTYTKRTVEFPEVYWEEIQEGKIFVHHISDGQLELLIRLGAKYHWVHYPLMSFADFTSRSYANERTALGAVTRPVYQLDTINDLPNWIIKMTEKWTPSAK